MTDIAVLAMPNAHIYVRCTSYSGVRRSAVVRDEKRVRYGKCDSRDVSRFHLTIRPIVRRKLNFDDAL